MRGAAGAAGAAAAQLTPRRPTGGHAARCPPRRHGGDQGAPRAASRSGIRGQVSAPV